MRETAELSHSLPLTGTAYWYSEHLNGPHGSTLEASEYRLLLPAPANPRPAPLRPAFGGKSLYKVTLDTKIASEANILFLKANAELETRFEEARARLKATGYAAPTARDRADELVAAYFLGPQRTDGGLDGTERLLLTRLEIDRGLWNQTNRGLSLVPPASAERWWDLSNNTALFRDYPGRKPVLDHPPGSIWRWADDSFGANAKLEQIARLVEQIARHHAIELTDLPDGIEASAITFLGQVPRRICIAGANRAQPNGLQPTRQWRQADAPARTA
ncbi:MULTISPECIES: hypothetical protein [unclassified Sphingomonas]|uniref:hypothetical protein n=1 Tax=unclassified Sphingomonas TaxID=196159 RepID=UPI00226A13F1|nr:MULTISPECIES: hypothetical protein [unclassified Sphingomonas]